jgi:hypothetical protein
MSHSLTMPTIHLNHCERHMHIVAYVTMVYSALLHDKAPTSRHQGNHTKTCHSMYVIVLIQAHKAPQSSLQSTPAEHPCRAPLQSTPDIYTETTHIIQLATGRNIQ